ncbi:unnamed protein product [Colletotrichum noveboracense]|uniref:Uncharacterized protein n=1 Tax=Colletotrichum noveboracense TaxID=2664923 RepID=A0A9W4RNR7_9PEZI|nr:unnamed protein product [Colletotrichum noveboracense]
MTGLGGSPGSSAPQSFKALLSEGNTISRNLAKVPKDQQKLLDRPGSWFTSHKDTNGPPNLPAGVLESLREFHAARTLPPPAQKPRAPVSSVPSPTGNARPAVVHNFSDHGQSSSSSSSPPGTLVSWPSSPERPRHSANQPASPTLSIKSQIGIESQLPATAATANLPSSPPQFSSPSIPAPKRFDPPANFPQPTLKRRRVEEFPSSSGGFEDELETAIPNALFQATPPINRIAAHLLTRSEAATSPPCGQGSMVPSSYNDGRMTFKSSTPKERRNMKLITFDSSPGASTADRPLEATPDELPTIPLSQPRENRVPVSSGPCIASTYAADSHQSAQAPQVVHDTPGAPRTLARAPGAENFLASQAEPSGSKSSTGLPEATITDEQRATIAEERDPMIIEDAEEETIGMEKPVLRVSMDDPVRWKKADDKRELIQWFNDNWAESDWLPPLLQEYRSTLSFSSLKTLQNITKLAIDGGVDLLSLWAEPDGCLYRTISRQTNGKLSFPEDLNHEALEPLAKASRLARERRAAQTANPTALQRQPSGEPFAVAAPVRDEAAVENAENDSAKSGNMLLPLHAPREETLECFSQQPAKAFQNAYPSFTGSVADFVRACIVVKGLQRKHQLPKWLYDDFIRAFVDDYTSYMDEVDKSSSIAKPMSAIRWYVANVDRPVYQKEVVTAENLDRIFEIYSEEVGEAKKWLLDGISSSPIVLETPQRPAANVSMARKHASPTLPVASMRKDDTKQPPSASGTTVPRSPAEGLRSPREVQAASEVVQAPIIGEQTSDEASLPEPKLDPSRQDKGKQRMAAEEPPRRVSPITPTLRRQKSPTSNNDDLVFASSHPRSRPTSVQAAGPEKTIKHESPTAHRTSPLDRSTPQKVPAIDQANGTLSERRRTGTVAETPPPAPKTAAAFPGNKVTSGAGKTAVRRTLPASFDFGPPSRPAVSSPARSTLSASTQDARVKKPKKTEKEKQEAYRRKIAKLFKQGRLPGSTPAPKGGDA